METITANNNYLNLGDKDSLLDEKVKKRLGDGALKKNWVEEH